MHSEKQIQVHVAPGITVDGRIDLVRRLDTDELSIVDFKSTARAQDEDVTRDQLHVYAVGYEELTGERADLIEVLNLDEEGKTIREEVEDPLLVGVRRRSATPATRFGTTIFRGCPSGASSAASATSPNCAATSLHWTRRLAAWLPAAKPVSRVPPGPDDPVHTRPRLMRTASPG